MAEVANLEGFEDHQEGEVPDVKEEGGLRRCEETEHQAGHLAVVGRVDQG